MSKHTIPLLEFVTAQPAHKLPVVFTNEKCPLPDCTESPEEIFKEVLTLQRQGWIEARINRDVIGKPSQVEIRYVTLEGSAFLHGRQADSQEGMPIGKLIIWGSGGITILILAILGAHFISERSPKHSELPRHELPVQVPTPASTPSPTPIAVATPESIPSASQSTSPSATPTPIQEVTPVPTPTPSSKSAEATPKPRSFKKEW